MVSSTSMQSQIRTFACQIISQLMNKTHRNVHRWIFYLFDILPNIRDAKLGEILFSFQQLAPKPFALKCWHMNWVGTSSTWTLEVEHLSTWAFEVFEHLSSWSAGMFETGWFAYMLIAQNPHVSIFVFKWRVGNLRFVCSNFVLMRVKFRAGID